MSRQTFHRHEVGDIVEVSRYRGSHGESAGVIDYVGRSSIEDEATGYHKQVCVVMLGDNVCTVDDTYLIPYKMQLMNYRYEEGTAVEPPEGPPDELVEDDEAQDTHWLGMHP